MRQKTNLMLLVAFIGLGTIFAGCAATTPETELAQLTVEKDSLKKAKKTIAKRLNEIDNLLEQLDTTIVKNIALVSVTQYPERKFDHFFDVQGVVETDQNAMIYAEVSAKVEDIKVTEGMRVKKGQLIMKLDDQILQNNIDEVQNQLDLAEIRYKKQKNLWDQKIGSEFQYLEAKNNRDALVKKLKTFESQRKMYFVTAPFNGVVDEIVPKEGEIASPMSMLVRLINLSSMYMKADISESYIGKVKEGDTVLVRFPSIDRQMKTTIGRVGNYINPNNRTFKIKLYLPNNDFKLKPNLLGELSIRDFSADKAVVIPSRIIQQTPTGAEFVYTLDNESGADRAKKAVITTGLSYKGETHILSGLAGNEKILTKGARSVKDGELVEVTN